MCMVTVQCPYCWEVVPWGEVPEHLADHGGDLEIVLVGVQGEQPKMVAVGEPSDEHVRIAQMKRE